MIPFKVGMIARKQLIMYATQALAMNLHITSISAFLFKLRFECAFTIQLTKERG